MGRKSKSDMRRPEILEHLYEVLKEEGIEGVSLAKVADRMGIYPSMIVHYFKTKEQMMIALVDFIIDKFEAWYRVQLDAIKDQRNRIIIILNEVLSLKGATVIDPGVFFGLVYMGFRNENIREKIHAMYGRLIEVLSNEIKMGIDNGVIEAADPETIAHLIAIIQEGLDYCRFEYRDLQKVEAAGGLLKEMIFNLLKINCNAPEEE